MKTQIKVERARRNMTQEQLAKALSVSVHAINAIEREKYMPSVVLAAKMAKYFDVTMDQLFILEDTD
jgi:putative transcriptional regulator